MLYSSKDIPICIYCELTTSVFAAQPVEKIAEGVSKLIAPIKIHCENGGIL